MNWDDTLSLSINGLAQQSETLDWLMFSLGRPFLFKVVMGLTVLYWVWAKRREALVGGAILLGLFIATDQLGAQLKFLVARARPCQVLSGMHHLVPCGGTFSFPSNHALNTALVASFLHVLYPRSGWIAWPIVALVGVSRVYIGAHYVTDVLGSWMIGGVLGAGTAWLLLRWPIFRRSEGRAARLRP